MASFKFNNVYIKDWYSIASTNETLGPIKKYNQVISHPTWFGKKEVFNIEKNKAWKTNYEKIIFPDDKNWKDYVLSRRLEITCGEAPYLVSRYDTVSGKKINVKDCLIIKIKIEFELYFDIIEK